MEYNKVYKSYENYVIACKEMIKKAFFDVKDASGIDIKDDSLGISDIVRKHRIKMIDIKVEHTMRMIEQIIKINYILGLKFDLGLVIKISVLYHDIGRIRQSTWCNTFNDRIYQRMNMPYNNHGEEGYDIFINNDFNVDPQYVPIVAQSILHHQDFHLYPNFNYKYKDGLRDIDISNIASGKTVLNDSEWQVVSLITQLVADIDKADILYQHLTDDFEMIKDYVYDSSNDSLEAISKRWEIPISEIKEYNHIDSEKYIPHRIKIPIKNLKKEKLAVPDYIKEMFYNNSWPELKELMTDKNWNFITILWWRLSHFLNGITFTSTLINIEESNLLKEIYAKIPDDLKPLVSEAFDYANSVLVEEKIDKFSNQIYLRR